MKDIKFEDIQKANESIITLDVKGKDYAEVNQRIKAFRMLYPQGTIKTDMLSNENGVCVFKTEVYDGELLLGTGTAYEKEGSTFINRTSYIENCETSSVGRALAMCGIGIDTSIASAEEVQNAIKQQEEPLEEKSKLVEKLQELVIEKEADLEKILNYYKVTRDKDMSIKQLTEAVKHLEEK